MITAIFWTLGIINVAIWGFNAMLTQARGDSGAGYVFMLTFPLAIVISLVSLVIVGFLT